MKIEHMACFCACNIPTLAHLQRFQQMVESWGQQSKTIPLYVSMSLEDKIAPIANRVIEKLRYSNLYIYETETPLEQFEHYYNLLGLLRGSLKFMWIMFTHGDDLWHPGRVEIYHHALETHGEEIISVMTKNFVINEEDISKPVNSWSDVTEVLGRIGFIPNNEYSNSGNCIHQCIRASVLRQFFDMLDPDLLHYRYCDWLLFKFIYSNRHPNCLVVNLNHPIYYLRCHTKFRIGNAYYCDYGKKTLSEEVQLLDEEINNIKNLIPKYDHREIGCEDIIILFFLYRTLELYVSNIHTFVIEEFFTFCCNILRDAGGMPQLDPDKIYEQRETLLAFLNTPHIRSLLSSPVIPGRL